jgi:hypothetical protein
VCGRGGGTRRSRSGGALCDGGEASGMCAQVGLLGLLLSEFRSALIVMPVYLVVFLAYAAVKVVRAAHASGAVFGGAPLGKV